MNKLYSTKQVAAMLHIRPDALSRAIWLGRLTAPAKGPGGSYLWTNHDIEHAGWTLLHKHVHIPAEIEGASHA